MNLVRTIVTMSCLSAGLLAPSCGPPNREITRVNPEAVTDVDYRFNDTDAHQVCQGMVNDALFRNWLDTWLQEHAGKRPTIIVGGIQNNTQDYINTKLFTGSFEREMLNSGKVRVVEMRDQRGELRDERLQGQEWNSPETRKIMKNERGADLMLMGDINDVKQRSPDGRTLVNFYQVNLHLADIETNEKVWQGNVEIKKVVRNP